MGEKKAEHRRYGLVSVSWGMYLYSTRYGPFQPVLLSVAVHVRVLEWHQFFCWAFVAGNLKYGAV